MVDKSWTRLFVTLAIFSFCSFFIFFVWKGEKREENKMFRMVVSQGFTTWERQISDDTIEFYNPLFNLTSYGSPKRESHKE